METGIEIIAKERARQIKEKGYTSEKDDKKIGGDLSDAAAIYAMGPAWRKLPIAPEFKKDEPITEKNQDGMVFTFVWPWQFKYYKPTHYNRDENTCDPETNEDIKARVHELAKAGALIAAEIDRLLRLKNR